MGNKKLPQSHARATLDEGSIGEWVDRSALTPWKKNPRKNKHAIKPLAEAIERMGFGAPIVARKLDGRVIAGHTRLLAAESLGMDRVPVRWVDVDDRTADMMALADNKLGELAEWDEPMLMAELGELGLDDAALAGWDSKELDALARNIDSGEVTEDEAPGEDRAEELRQKYGVELGQLWQLGEHRILCGDSTKAEDVTRALDGLAVEMMVTDPPYGVEYDPGWRVDAGVNKNQSKLGKVLNDDRADWTDAWRLFPGDAAYVYHNGIMTCAVAESLKAAGFGLRSQIIWNKDRMALGRGDYHWKHEPCWYVVRVGSTASRNDDLTQTTVWDIPARDDAGHGHGTQKPVECMARPIRNHTFSNIYEPFSGSGTTIIACEQLGRKCRAIELSPGYVAIAIERWAVLTGKEPVLLS